MTGAQWTAYEKAMRSGDFLKLARLRFLNPDGSTAFTVDNQPNNPKSGAFIRSGSVSVNLQNGVRRTADVTLANVDGTFDYNVEKVWFGSEIAVDMGVRLQDGTELYFPQGVYRVTSPQDTVEPSGRTVRYGLTDKWAGLDGSLNGTLDSSYIVNLGTNIFAPMEALLQMDRGDGQPYDRVAPVFTEYYNGKTQALPGGGTAAITNTPYTLTVDSDEGSVADVILGLAEMLVAWVGYDPTGRLRVDPSQNDILDTDKPVTWRFSLDEAQVLGLAYDVKLQDVKNDYIVVGMMADNYSQPAARAQNLDPRSDTNINLIGRKTKRESKPEYATERICMDYAEWMVKRTSVLHRAVTIQCNQIFHLTENTLIEVVRSDLPGAPVEKHLVQGFTLPLSGTEAMSITATSVHDFPSITLSTWPPAEE